MLTKFSLGSDGIVVDPDNLEFNLEGGVQETMLIRLTPTGTKILTNCYNGRVGNGA